MITLQERVHSVPLPEDWHLNKLHRVLRVRKGIKNVGMKEDNLLSLSYGRIIRKDIDSAEGLLPESFETYQIVEPGNIVMRLTDLQNDKRSIRQGLVINRGIITSAYDALDVSKDHDPRFWAYTLLALDLAKYYYSLGAGVRQSIKFADFPNDWIRAPGLKTQTSIADFLDRETARIDQLVEKKERLLEAQKERRLSEVTYLLTNGLKQNVPRKPSGIDWLSDIPAHWEWVRMKDVCREIIDCKNRTPPQFESTEYLVARTTCIKNGEFNPEGGYFTDKVSFNEWTRRGIPQENDVLITREAPMGEACLFPVGAKLCLGQRMMLYRPDLTLIIPKYIIYTIYSSIGENYIGLRRKGSTVGHLRVPEVYNFPCLLPPLEEQADIVRILDARAVRYISLRKLLNQSIARLREFRAALITAAVTGQVDVATWGKKGHADRRLEQIAEEMTEREGTA